MSSYPGDEHFDYERDKAARQKVTETRSLSLRDYVSSVSFEQRVDLLMRDLPSAAWRDRVRAIISEARKDSAMPNALKPFAQHLISCALSPSPCDCPTYRCIHKRNAGTVCTCGLDDALRAQEPTHCIDCGGQFDPVTGAQEPPQAQLITQVEKWAKSAQADMRAAELETRDYWMGCMDAYVEVLNHLKELRDTPVSAERST